MKNSILIILLLFLSISCIENDLPYPQIQVSILSISAENETSAAVIDSEKQSVELSLPETANLATVKFKEFAITDNAKSSEDLINGTFDLTKPLKITLTKFQSYEWTIYAKQTIERYFSIAGQVGPTTIDEVGHRVIVYIPDNLDIKNLQVTSIKLGPVGKTTIEPFFEPGYYDFSKPKQIKVSYFDRTEIWTIYVDTTSSVVTTTAVDAWTNVVWAYATAPEDMETTFQYKKMDDIDWIDVPKQYITKIGGVTKAYIPHLSPLTDYTVRAVAGENIGNEINVKTESVVTLPDGSFDNWWLDDKVWCPWDKNSSSFWDSGNKGAATLGQSNVTPSDYLPTGFAGKSAKLETKFVGIASIGKLAAGSVYVGYFKKVDGTNGILSYGREWTTRPTRLTGWFDYKTAAINYASNEFKYLLNRPDSCFIYVALTDWNEPYEMRTNPKDRQLFDKNMPSIIAYGELVCGENTNGYQKFDIKLDYRATNRKPRYLVICAVASKYGDYFTGAAGAVLHIDDLELNYDY